MVTSAICPRGEHLSGPEDARFCVECGWPIRQTCPYDADHWIPLTAGRTAPQQSCPICSRVFSHCPGCHRLYTIRPRKCNTPSCHKAELVAPHSDWPCDLGSTRRTNCLARPRGDLPREVLKISASGEGPVRVISSYGRLYTVCGRRLAIPVDGGEAVQPQTLASVVADTTEALACFRGHLGVLTEHAALLADPGSLEILHSIPGEFLGQTAFGDEWILTRSGPAAGEPPLLIFDINSYESRPLLLPDTGESASAPKLCVDGETLWIACSDARLCRYRRGMEQPEPVNEPIPDARCAHLLLAGERLVQLVIQKHEGRQDVLVSHTAIPRERLWIQDVARNGRPILAASGDRVYVVDPLGHRIIRFSLTAPSQTREERDLPATDNVTAALGLDTDDGDPDLLLLVRTGQRWELRFYSFDPGSTEHVADWPHATVTPPERIIPHRNAWVIPWARNEGEEEQ